MVDIYNIDVKDSANSDISLSEFAGKTLLIVNVASKCGLTPQYEGLQKLYDAYKDRNFVVLGFPCNQFGGQEPGTHDEICQFTSETFGVDFPLMGKIEVKGENQSAIYEELTKVTGSDGYQGVIRWNFEKFLIDNQGNKTRFSSQSSVIDIIQ